MRVLADGMGGEGRGDLAAKVVVDSFIRTFERSALDPPKRLRPALQSANAALDELKRSDPDLPANMGLHIAGPPWSGMAGSIGSASEIPCSSSPSRAICGSSTKTIRAPPRSTGRSRPVRSTPRPPGWIPGAISWRRLWSAGRFPLIDECVTPVRLSAGDMIIIASDGIQTLSEKALSDAIANAPGGGAEAAAHAVVRAVERAHDPDQDNATVMVIDVGMSAERFDPVPARTAAPGKDTATARQTDPAEDAAGLFSRKLAEVPKTPPNSRPSRRRLGLPPRPRTTPGCSRVGLLRFRNHPNSRRCRRCQRRPFRSTFPPVAVDPRPDGIAADPEFDLDDVPAAEASTAPASG